ncbi:MULTISPECIES: ferritin-like domain-containing protein [unclassified Cryobacterium]|uniref:ferritin-like domain-containing protein n=1 Tax=unclassified Cryobacterium TaxID=2649013 RepID=UPI002AB35029|nr:MULTISPECIES: ferritin-like domain-containing protein [Cryobacterium]MDY7526384.1 ferritin-like domain-containing protein [Cryobacterium sp. 10C2]MDY7557811.1 ferritin-like domain-containing protein [Cryobacterium sp. 10C3]MEB0004686.1 ferritin-like domain-containing protein [Cryobacterium sp. RTC2.1]MEB0203434.1 ferritin-like domain-containing protein [Cryobacterium sp. 5I3]MEB0287750.1 ferritin-like domain-containing protein [Cryobacterium sp. 10S3]
MFDQKFITHAIGRSAESPLDRRRFFQAAGVAGFGVGSAVLLAGQPAFAGESGHDDGDNGDGPSDSSILNFALNLEYLEAEFYLRAVTGSGLPDDMTTGRGDRGSVSGGRAVSFDTPLIRKYAEEIAADEKSHVAFLRSALGNAAVSRPKLSLDSSFTAAARAAGLIGSTEQFDVYANEVNFLFGAFIFEDVGVTSYKGAAPLISNKTYLDAAAGLLAVEAYHAGIIRTTLYALGVNTPAIYSSVQKISDARDSLDGSTDLDQGIGTADKANLVPTDNNGLAFSRTTGQVLNIAYLNPKKVRSGGFYPAGVNGKINTSGAN